MAKGDVIRRIGMIRRVEVRAHEIQKGDRLHQGPLISHPVSATVAAGDTVEVWTVSDDPLGMPAATYGAGEVVPVWREVSR
jgi:hypothetical protein